MSPSTTNLLVYGSCVSRDVVPFLGEGWTLLRYVARQSLVSAMSAPVAPPAQPALDSAFQRRMVTEDLTSAAPGLLRAHAEEIDVLVLDLVDERLGVMALPDGGYVTRSQELLASGLLEHLGGREVVFGTDEHFELWRDAADRFVGLLEETSLAARTVVVEGTFAARTDGGGSANRWRDEPAEVWNARYERYHAVLRGAGLRTYTVGADAVASTAHRWGPAAYHYADGAYVAMARAVRDTAELRAGPRAGSPAGPPAGPGAGSPATLPAEADTARGT